MITPLPNAWLQKPGSATLPFFGVVPVLLDEKGHEVKGEGEGYLCIKQVCAAASWCLCADKAAGMTTMLRARCLCLLSQQLMQVKVFLLCVPTYMYPTSDSHNFGWLMDCLDALSVSTTAHN